MRPTFLYCEATTECYPSFAQKMRRIAVISILLF